MTKIGEILSGDTKKELYKKAKRKRKKKKKENLSFKDIESLMGVHRDRYGRGRGGAMRQK